MPKFKVWLYADVEKFSPSNLVVRMTNDINQVQQIIMAFSSRLPGIPILFIGAVIPCNRNLAAIVVGDCRDDGTAVWRQLLFI